MTKALSQAIAELAGAFGEPPGTWTWGRVQTAAFAHAPFGLSGAAAVTGRSSRVAKAVDREAEGRLALTPEGDEK